MRAILLALLAVSASAERVELKEGGFSFEVPKGWYTTRTEKDGDAAKAPTMTLIGLDRGPLKSLIHVNRFLPGNTYYKDADAFLRKNLDPKAVRIPGSKMGPLRPTKLAGLPAKRFRYDTFDYLNPDTINPIEIPMVEETVVASDAGGFWVVTLSAPKEFHPQASKAFAKVLSSLKLGR